MRRNDKMAEPQLYVLPQRWSPWTSHLDDTFIQYCVITFLRVLQTLPSKPCIQFHPKDWHLRSVQVGGRLLHQALHWGLARMRLNIISSRPFPRHTSLNIKTSINGRWFIQDAQNSHPCIHFPKVHMLLVKQWKIPHKLWCTCLTSTAPPTAQAGRKHWTRLLGVVDELLDKGYETNLLRPVREQVAARRFDSLLEFATAHFRDAVSANQPELEVEVEANGARNGTETVATSANITALPPDLLQLCKEFLACVEAIKSVWIQKDLYWLMINGCVLWYLAGMV